MCKLKSREVYCARCDIHGDKIMKRGHSKCPNKTCKCVACDRNTQRTQLNKDIQKAKPCEPLTIGKLLKRTTNLCEKCVNHGIYSPYKNGHKFGCDFKTCTRGRCGLIDKKRRLMADIKRERLNRIKYWRPWLNNKPYKIESNPTIITEKLDSSVKLVNTVAKVPVVKPRPLDTGHFPVNALVKYEPIYYTHFQYNNYNQLRSYHPIHTYG